MADSKIEWTNKTWNPTVGCTRISPGCKHCYAFTLHDMRHEAFKNGKAVPRQYAKPFTQMQMMVERLNDPLKWRKPQMVFVNSVSDLFHEDVPDQFISSVFDTMDLARRHTFQILTKRAKRMANLVPQFAARHTAGNGTGWPMQNVWLGVSTENQEYADKRIPHLFKTPAAVRFLSCEPLLGPLELQHGSRGAWIPSSDGFVSCGTSGDPIHVGDGGRGVDWVIVGGESGTGARPCRLTWIRDIVRQCADAGVPCFVKQLGSNVEEGYGMNRKITLKDSKGGDQLEWPEDLRVREFPEVASV